MGFVRGVSRGVRDVDGVLVVELCWGFKGEKEHRIVRLVRGGS